MSYSATRYPLCLLCNLFAFCYWDFYRMYFYDVLSALNHNCWSTFITIKLSEVYQLQLRLSFSIRWWLVKGQVQHEKFCKWNRKNSALSGRFWITGLFVARPHCLTSSVLLLPFPTVFQPGWCSSLFPLHGRFSPAGGPLFSVFLLPGTCWSFQGLLLPVNHTSAEGLRPY